MRFADKLSQPGETVFTFSGQAGELEGILTVPQTRRVDYVAVLGHPNSLQGGSMSNKVVTTLARAFRELGIASLRFNFRGVGQSQGEYDNGIGESEDMLILCGLWAREFPESRFIFAGFSFGSWVTYRTASQWPHALLVSVAPPVNLYDFHHFQPRPTPWHIIMGDEDEVVPATAVHAFAQQLQPPVPVSRFAQTTHFFHGRLLELKADVIKAIQERVLNP